jgi:hypothetical protein
MFRLRVSNHSRIAQIVHGRVVLIHRLHHKPDIISSVCSMVEYPAKDVLKFFLAVSGRKLNDESAHLRWVTFLGVKPASLLDFDGTERQCV